MRLGVLCSRFPKLSETFVLDEMVELEARGFDVLPLALRHETPAVSHPEAPRMALLGRAALRGCGTAGAQLRWLRRDRSRYLSTWAGALRGNARSPRFLARAVVVVPLAARLAVVAERQGLERIHAHYATHPALAAWVINRLTGLPFTFTAHAHDIQVDRAMLAEKARAADFVVTISEHNRRLLGGWLPGVRVEVVRCGVDPDRFEAVPLRAPGPPGRLRLACVGSLEPYKGHAVLLEALARIDPRLDVVAELAGDGPARAALERAAIGLDVAHRVRFLGPLARPDVDALLARSDAFVLPSVVTPSGKCEGLPVAIMEAMAAGLPVVASAISGVPELVRHEDTGLLVEQRDPDGLAAAIQRLAADPGLRRRLGRRGRRLVLAEHDRVRNVAALARLLGGADGASSGADRVRRELAVAHSAGDVDRFRA